MTRLGVFAERTHRREGRAHMDVLKDVEAPVAAALRGLFVGWWASMACLWGGGPPWPKKPPPWCGQALLHGLEGPLQKQSFPRRMTWLTLWAPSSTLSASAQSSNTAPSTCTTSSASLPPAVSLSPAPDCHPGARTSWVHTPSLCHCAQQKIMSSSLLPWQPSTNTMPLAGFSLSWPMPLVSHCHLAPSASPRASTPETQKGAQAQIMVQHHHWNTTSN